MSHTMLASPRKERSDGCGMNGQRIRRTRVGRCAARLATAAAATAAASASDQGLPLVRAQRKRFCMGWGVR